MTACKSLTDYLGLIGNSQDELLVLFVAQWSIPSTVLSQDLQPLLEEYQIKNVTIDFNDCPDVFHKYNISILPCVRLLQDGEMIGEVRGNNFEAVREMLDKNIHKKSF